MTAIREANRGLWLDEMSAGMVVRHAITRTITEADNTLFSVMTMNPQALHIDAHRAAATEFGERLVNSLFTLGLLIGITVHELTLNTTVANLGFTAVEFPRPLFHGDTLAAESTILEVRDSASRPGQGIALFEHRGYNQDGELVASCKRNALMLKSPPPPAPAAPGS
jgi:acyl dehydratase